MGLGRFLKETTEKTFVDLAGTFLLYGFTQKRIEEDFLKVVYQEGVWAWHLGG